MTGDDEREACGPCPEAGVSPGATPAGDGQNSEVTQSRFLRCFNEGGGLSSGIGGVLLVRRSEEGCVPSGERGGPTGGLAGS